MKGNILTLIPMVLDSTFLLPLLTTRIVQLKSQFEQVFDTFFSLSITHFIPHHIIHNQTKKFGSNVK